MKSTASAEEIQNNSMAMCS